MKVLIVNRFFGGAQIPTGRMAEDAARILVEDGHEVVALASSGVYAGAVAQARDQETKRPKDQKTAGQRSEIGNQKSETGNGTLRVETVRVPKCMPRALAWLWFAWQARKRIPRMDWDVCVLMTDPPLLPLLARRAAGMRHEAYGIGKEAQGMRRVAVWLMDLYPEALAASGRIAKSNPIYRWYFEKRQRALGASDLLICLGEAQRKRLQTKRQPEVGGLRPETGDGLHGNQLVKDQELESAVADLDSVKTAVVPPWDDRGNISLATEGSLKNLALYAGNLGEAHCFEEILAAAPYLPGDWKIRFAARGAKLGALRAKASHREFSHSRPQGDRQLEELSEAVKFTQIDTDGVRAAVPTGLGGNAHTKVTLGARNASSDQEIAEVQEGAASLLASSSFGLFSSLGATVEITGYASEEETPGLLASARVHLITMSPGWEGIVVPSKLYGCVRTGRPVVFIGPENADTAREIRAHDWGKVLPPGASGEEVAAAILELAARPTRSVRPEYGAQKVAELIQGLATAEQRETA